MGAQIREPGSGEGGQRVADAVTSLPQPERDALVLHVWEGLSYEEIAVALGVPIGTVRSRLNRARTRLRELADPDRRQPQPEADHRRDQHDPGELARQP